MRNVVLTLTPLVTCSDKHPIYRLGKCVSPHLSAGTDTSRTSELVCRTLTRSPFGWTSAFLWESYGETKGTYKSRRSATVERRHWDLKEVMDMLQLFLLNGVR